MGKHHINAIVYNRVNDMYHVTGSIIEVAIGFKRNVGVRNITDPLNKYKVIYYHMHRLKTHIYLYVLCYPQKDTIQKILTLKKLTIHCWTIETTSTSSQNSRRR